MISENDLVTGILIIIIVSDLYVYTICDVRGYLIYRSKNMPPVHMQALKLMLFSTYVGQG